MLALCVELLYNSSIKREKREILYYDRNKMVLDCVIFYSDVVFDVLWCTSNKRTISITGSLMKSKKQKMLGPLNGPKNNYSTKGAVSSHLKEVKKLGKKEQRKFDRLTILEAL